MKFTKSTRAKDIQRAWHFFDLKDKVLGRTATEIALFLMGKHKPYYVSNLDCGDYVVVVNATRVVVTGKKSVQKIYDHYSGYPGGRKEKTYRQLMAENPKRIILEAVAGMLPKNRLRDMMLKRLYIYTDDQHPYKARFESVKK
jgi:large subunit ribosomal protein L13